MHPRDTTYREGTTFYFEKGKVFYITDVTCGGYMEHFGPSEAAEHFNEMMKTWGVNSYQELIDNFDVLEDYHGITIIFCQA